MNCRALNNTKRENILIYYPIPPLRINAKFQFGFLVYAHVLLYDCQLNHILKRKKRV